MKAEKFYDIPGYEGFYVVDVNGTFKSVERTVKCNKGVCILKERVLTPSVNSNGYLKVGLSENNKVKNFPVHRLLAVVFIPNPHGHPLVRHLDDNKMNNSLNNLAWGTDLDNSKDSVKNGTFRETRRGKRHHWYGRRVVPPNAGKTGVEALYNKIILNPHAGVFYYGTKDAANSVGINVSTLRCMLSGHTKNKTNLIYV